MPLLAEVHQQRVQLQRVLALLDQRTRAGADSLARLLDAAGPRSYFLTSEDQWSLADLVDISKGAAFAQTPVWLKRVTTRVQNVASQSVLSS